MLTQTGGGGAGSQHGGGGGAGGYRSSVLGEASGANSPAETVITVEKGDIYSISVGAGGTGGSSGQSGTSGTDSTITSLGKYTITSVGGGGGYGWAMSPNNGNYKSLSGGSGGGSALNNLGGDGTALQGFKGGSTVGDPTYPSYGTYQYFRLIIPLFSSYSCILNKFLFRRWWGRRWRCGRKLSWYSNTYLYSYYFLFQRVLISILV